MKKKLTYNLGLKIISLLFAIALWLVVVNINDPVIARRFTNIPVKFVNTNVITENGKVFEVLDNTDVIGVVTVTAQRSTLEGIDSSDIVAIADFQSGLQEDGNVAISLSCSRYNSRISTIKGSTDVVKLNVENKRSLQMVLKATTSGEVAEGCLVGNVVTDQNLIRMEGPESVVSQIARAGVNVDVSGASSTVATYESVVLYDADGNEVSHPALTTNCNQVRVSVEILGTKEVPVECQTKGAPGNGYLETGEITVNPASVLVCGTANNLSKISSIIVPETELDITGQTEDMTTEVALSSYLPNGISFVNNEFDGNVSVTVGIAKAETKTITIEKESLVVVNVPEGFEAKAIVDGGDEEAYSVNIIGLPQAVNSIDTRKIIGYVDMNVFMYDTGLSGAEELESGIYEVNLLFNNLGENKIVTPVKARLEVTAVTEDEQGEEQE